MVNDSDVILACYRMEERELYYNLISAFTFCHAASGSIKKNFDGGKRFGYNHTGRFHRING